MNKIKDLYHELLRACHEGNLRSLKSLVVSFSQEISWSDCHYEKSGDGVLHLAARHGHCEIIKFLAEECCYSDMEQINADVKRPLHEAAQGMHVDCVKYLLQQGVKVDPLKRGDWTPLMLACTKVGNLQVVKLLIDSGSNPLLKNKDGWNCFHIACREGDTNIVSFLMNVSPQVWNTSSKNGRTPLHTAALHGHMQVVDLVLNQCSYSKNARDTCGCTPIMDAARAGHLDVVNLLHSHRADVHQTDKMGKNILHAAAEAGATAMVEAIIQNYLINVNCETSKGNMTALHWATKEGHLETVKKLVELGADVNLLDSHNRSALTMATYGRNPAIVEFLEQISAASSYQ